MSEKNLALISLGLEGWPADWSPWVVQTMGELYEAERVNFDFIPENAPDWVYSILTEAVKVLQPDLKWTTFDQPGESVLGFAIGYFKNILESENGLPKQLDRFCEFSEKRDAELRKKWGARKYDRFMRKNRRYVADVEHFFENMQTCYERKYEVLGKCFAAAIQLPLDQQAHFFGAYVKAISTDLFDPDGQALRRTTSTPLYVWIVIFWRYVRLMPSATVLHQWLCRLFGPQQVGELGRIKQLCFRHKIRLRHQGRPKKKK
jgi:hypothetical protein